MINSILFTTFIALSFVLPAAAGVSTNGGSFTSDKNNVWNLGEGPVPYCIVVDSKFALPAAEVRAVIEESILDWQAFFWKYGLDKMKFEGLNHGASLGVALNFRYTSACSSTQHVRFYIGAAQGQLLKRAFAHDEHPGLGFAVRDSYNHETYRNGGVMWIPKWRFNRVQFKHMILHEIGHVLGMEHNSVHVMDERIADRIVSYEYTPDLLGRIETPIWFYKLRDGEGHDLTFNGRFDGGSESNAILSHMGDILGFSIINHHKLTLVPRAVGNSWQITLEFREYETGQIRRLVGWFLFRTANINSENGIRGPVLFTNFRCFLCTTSYERTMRHLDKDSTGSEAQGVFRLLGTNADYLIPAFLERRTGLTLQAYVPNDRGWWSTANYLGTTYSK